MTRSSGVGYPHHWVPGGREIVLTTPLTVQPDPPKDGRRWVRDLVITWHESPAEPVPSLAAGAEGATEPSRWVEQPQISLVAAGKAWQEGLVLARLSRSARGGVEVDTSMRRPLAPAGTGGGGDAGAS